MYRITVNFLYLSLLIALLSCGDSVSVTRDPEGNSSPTKSENLPEGYELVWKDEFDTDGSPNSTKWSYDLGSLLIGGSVWGNNENQHYTNDPDNIYISNGSLFIQPKYETPSGASAGVFATSARIKSETQDYWNAIGNEPYGFYEIRAKISCIAGSWPAVWMLGKTGDWPQRGEIDILEWFGVINDKNRSDAAVHNGAYSGGDLDKAPASNPQKGHQKLSNLCTDFHLFQLHWKNDSLTMSVDGVPTLTYRKLSGHGTNEWPFDQPAFLIMNVAVGGNLGGSVNTSDIPSMGMEIDYVRVWQSSD